MQETRKRIRKVGMWAKKISPTIITMKKDERLKLQTRKREKSANEKTTDQDFMLREHRIAVWN